MAETINPAFTSEKPQSRVVNILLWIAQILLAAMFIFSGFHKVSGDPIMIGVFEKVGMGQWFRYLTGGLELLAGIGLLIPRFAGISAVVLAVVMVGAVITHIAILGGSFAVPLALMILLAVVAWRRMDGINALLGRK
ncbi:MAG: DoxX family protein [Candidatus Kapaibacterium sp.]